MLYSNLKTLYHPFALFRRLERQKITPRDYSKKKKHHKNEELKLAKWVYRYKLVYHSASSLPDG